nr:hypothetical protein [Tanacetum cinerariifolium]
VDSDFEADKGSKQPEGGSKSNVYLRTNGAYWQRDGMHRPPTLPSFLHDESNHKKVNFRILEMEQTDLADVLFLMSLVLEKFSVKRVMRDNKKVSSSLNFLCNRFGRDGLSAIATHLGNFAMLDSYTVTICMQSWVCMDYARALVDIWVDRALKDTMVISILKSECKQETRGSNSLLKPHVLKSAYQKKTTSTPVSNVFSALEKDNGKPMYDLFYDTRKKVEAPFRKTDIWSCRKTDSSRINVVFSHEMKLHYFDRDDMEFDDINMEQVVEKVEHENAFSKNG